MAILKFLGFGFVGAAVLLGGFFQYAQKEMDNFKIDYSQTPGKVILVTGANSGLGYYTALELAKHDAQVILACRSATRCQEAKQNILKEAPNGKVDALTLDLSSFQSIKDFVKEFESKYPALDVLVNNAGIMALPNRETTKDGLEAQIGTNHFGHFLLTSLLYPLLTQNGRIINHSSSAHAFAAKNFVFKDLLSEQVYDPWVAYGNSKIANLLFTYELNRRLEKAGNPKNIVSIALHPGYTATNLQNSRFPFWEQINSLVAMKGHHGALSQIYVAVDPSAKVSNNDYVGPAYVALGVPSVQTTSSDAWDVDAQNKLWTESERLTGVKFL
mmetsp:Transcript_24253/g.26525  ORF Transcript_24253/g.26525 Transcript_24253/m.26525 type:complete len:329 (+) Transcript_24253:98-1084(+)|eukprot:CAMPEP_0173158388 /NCGR_PEP_ID=MMETSP1105-20130129/16308_1 /TAXON_ID=2985 /ORGANISM="Ochromonas sp., Strain BG-1" /LENGTH=328 /DNA_ID=CAMNT_0014076269 /DNA_START=16 /DNA_END=1002 /DNA_ORIENTATION=+